MKLKSLSLICCFLIAAMILAAAPHLAFGSTRDLAELQAREDARADAKVMQYGLVGCALPLIVVLYNEIAPVSPPAHRLLGKSPMYVEWYTKAYKQQIRSSRRIAALAGTVIGTVGLFVLREMID